MVSNKPEKLCKTSYTGKRVIHRTIYLHQQNETSFGKLESGVTTIKRHANMVHIVN